MSTIKSYSNFLNEEKDNIKELKTDKKPVLTKTARIVKGDNPFIDTKSGNIVAMDICLNEDEMKKVIEYWKTGTPEGKEQAANILLTYGIRERHMQFNLAFAMMMSGLCFGTGACISKLTKITEVETVKDVIETKDKLPPVQVHNALLKFYQNLGDNLEITKGKEFINASAPKEKLVELFDKMADAKGVSRDDFMRKMFDITHGGKKDLVDTEIDYFNKCLEDDGIKSVGDIFNNTDASDMTGVKGFNPFGIKSPEAAEKLAQYFNDTEVVTGIEEITKEITKEIIKEVPASEIAQAATAGALASELYVGGVRDDDKKGSRKDKVDAKYKELLNKWKEEQRKAGKNTSPGEGTRKRLRRQAEEMVKENKTIMSYNNFLVILS